MAEILSPESLKEIYTSGTVLEVKHPLPYGKGLFIVISASWGEFRCERKQEEDSKELIFADTERRNSLPKGIYIVISYADNNLFIESLSPDATKPELVRGFVLQKVDWDGEKVTDYHEFYFLEIRKGRKWPRVLS